MKLDNKTKLLSNGNIGVSFMPDRGYTNFGVIKKWIRVEIEVPTLFYGNNMCGGEIDAEYIGAFTYFNYNPEFRDVKKVGRFCAIGQNVMAGIGNHSISSLSSHQMFEIPQWWAKNYWEYSKKWIDNNIKENFNVEPERIKPLEIGNDVWIGAGVCILKGIKIGNGAVVAAGSVVTKDVGAYEIVAGCPAKTIRKRFSDEIIERLEKIAWWKYGPNILKDLNISHPEKCIEELEHRTHFFPLYKPDRFLLDCSTDEIYKINADNEKRELVYKL